jgi:hypothetical protein
VSQIARRKAGWRSEIPLDKGKFVPAVNEIPFLDTNPDATDPMLSGGIPCAEPSPSVIGISNNQKGSRSDARWRGITE